MIKNVVNSSNEVQTSLYAKYLASYGNASQKGGLFEIEPDGLVLLRIQVSGFDSKKYKAVNSKLKLFLNNICDECLFKLYSISEQSFYKSNAREVGLNSVIDTILYNGKNRGYITVEGEIEFDLTKFMYNELQGFKGDKYLYFALKTDKKFNVNCLDTTSIIKFQLSEINGLDAIYEYSQEDIGYAGVSSINLANGKLIHKVDLIQTDNEDCPASFHLFFNNTLSSPTNLLGEHWLFGGNYIVEKNMDASEISLTDASGKKLILESCSDEDIKSLYNIRVPSELTGNYYVCLTEPMYCVVNNDSVDKIIFVDKNDNRMFFEGEPSRITKIELSSKKVIEYVYSGTRLIGIKDGEGQRLTIEYRNEFVNKVSHYNKNNIKLGYSEIEYIDGNISRLKSYIGDESECYNEAHFEYDSQNRLSKIFDIKGGIHSEFQYSSSDEVVKITHCFSGDPDKQKYTTYDYHTFQTIVTDYTGYRTSYYFDYFGRCKTIIDEEGKSITRNYDDIKDGVPGELASESKLQINERNLIENTSFDSSDNLFDNSSRWYLSAGKQENIKIIDGGVYGQKCLKIEKDKSSRYEITQKIDNIVAGSYTLSGFFKAINIGYIKEGDIKVLVNVSYRKRYENISRTIDKYYKTHEVVTTYYTNMSRNYEISNDLTGSFDWKKYSTIVSIPGGSDISDLKVTVKIVLTGEDYTAFIDDLSLSYGDHNVRYNFVNNGYFENDMLGWESEGLTYGDGAYCHYLNDGHSKVLGDYVLRINGSARELKKVYRRVYISGNAGDELLLTMFGKGIISTNELFAACLLIHYSDNDSERSYQFDFDTNYENWQVLTRKVIAERAYDYVDIEIKVKAEKTVLIDAIQLYKDSFGKEFAYTNKKDMSQMVNEAGETSEVSFNDDSNVSEVTDESGDTYRFVYDSNKKVKQITNNQNTKVLFRYTNGKKTSTTVISSNYDMLKTSSKFDGDNLISETDDAGNTTTYKYDSLGRKTEETAANSAVTKYKYNAYGQLIEQLTALDNDQSKCEYEYDSHGNISEIRCANGTVYTFIYTCDLQLAEVLVNGKTFSANRYTKTVNGINSNLLTEQVIGNKSFKFNYDKKQRLTKVYYDNNLQVEYKYNERSQITEVRDAVNNITEYLSYDANGNVVRNTSSNGTKLSYNYDNLGNLQKLTQSIDGILRSYDYEYKCEYNDYTPSGYFTRLQRAFPDEVIKGGSGLNGVYGGIASLKTLRDEKIDVDDEAPVGDKVPSLSFKKDNAVLSYSVSTLNKNRKTESSTQKSFIYRNWKSKFNDTRHVFGWIKPYNNINGEQRIFAFGRTQIFGIRFKLISTLDGKVKVIDTNKKIEIVSAKGLNFNTWNLIGFKTDFDNKNKERKLCLILNDEYYEKSYYDTLNEEERYFMIGAPSDSISSKDVYGLDKKGYLAGNTTYPINMPFRLAYASVGSTDISEKDYMGIYKEGVKYLKNEPNYGASGVTFFNHLVYKDMDVISLNGSFTSLKEMKPKVYSYTEESFKVEKTRMFKFDNTGVNPVYRHVYASYDSFDNLNKGNASKLAYDFLIKNKGTITLRFKVDEFDSKEKVLLCSKKSGLNLKLYFINRTLYLSLNDIVKETCNIEDLGWHFVALRFNENKCNVQADDKSIEFTFNSIINLDEALTYIGCDVDYKNKPINHLNGCIEMLAFKDEYVPDSQINDIYYNGMSMSVRTYYDELGRTSKKKLHIDNKIISKEYEYQSKNNYTTTKIAQETNYIGDTINYLYDEVGNIKSATLKSADGNIIEDRRYVNDGLSRLTKSTIGNVTHTYVYDSNNNIKYKDNIEYFYDENVKDRLVSRSDGSSIEYNDNFFGNPTRIKVKERDLKLSWNGRRLFNVNNNSYTYNQDGIRIGKTTSMYIEKYYLDGNNIIALKRTTNGLNQMVDFIYDEAQMLVGLSYNGNVYFYDRSINGDINAIIDKHGTAIVKYKYGDFGELLDANVADTDEARLIYELNPFIYKGYFYDKETKFYYLKARYYDPELGRFISADGEVGSIGNTMGMNLYAYCKCNPINYEDENGNWPSLATKICIGLAVIAVCAIVAAATAGTGAACIGMGMLLGATKGAAIGAISGAVTGAVTGAVKEGIRTKSWEGAWKGAISGAVNGAADGFMFGAIGGAVAGGINSKLCFAAGTLVMTKQGLKAIEEISVGEEVLAYNSNLGIYEYKDVVDVYVNKSKELCHIETDNDEIICTPNHSILTSNGWKEAKDISCKDLLVTSKGTSKVQKVEKEFLKDEINVYNLNVLGYHTYVIGKDLVVVHNNCTDIKAGATQKVKYKYKGKDTYAYNTNGKDIFYAIDRGGHGGSVYKGFKYNKNKKILTWIGDFDENLVLITNKHKSAATTVFKAIKIIDIK